MNKKATEHYDVVVAGGGSAGVAAAIGAARMGARTLLLERYGFLGGAATSSLVLTYCGFYTGGSIPQMRTVGGVGWELLQRLQAMGFDTAPVRSKSGNRIVMIDLEGLKVALDRMVLAEHIALNFHTRLVAAHRDGDRISAVTVADHEGLREISAGAFVDASGEASLCAYAGVPMSQPGGPGARLQPASFPMRVDGVPPGVPFDRARMTELVAQYNASADMPITRADGGVVMRLPISNEIWWMTVDLDTDGVSGADLARAETRAREQAWRLMDVLRRHPGFENAHLSLTGPQLGIRESRRPFSEGDATGDDAREGRRCPDGIARASWPMEVHVAPGVQRFVDIGGGGWFDIAHASLVARGLRNLRLAGRVVGADAEAYGSLRVMGTAFATGHAAGISAALQVSSGGSAPGTVRQALAAQDGLV